MDSSMEKRLKKKRRQKIKKMIPLRKIKKMIEIIKY